MRNPLGRWKLIAIRIFAIIAEGEGMRGLMSLGGKS